MNKQSYLYLVFISYILLSCSRKTEDKSIASSLAAQEFEFEIYDSLIVDYLGMVQLMDISPNQESFLLIDQNTDSMIVANKSGKILHTFIKKGEGPDDYQGNRSGSAKFVTNDSFIVPTITGMYQYSLEGKLLKKYLPEDFTGNTNLLIPNNQVHWIDKDQIYVYSPGRYTDLGVQGINYQTGSKQLEVVDMNTGSYSPIIPFPKASKYSSDTKEYGAVDFYPTFQVANDSLYLAFRNEPKIYTYSLTNLEAPALVQPIPFPSFIERNTNAKVENGVFNTRDFLLGTINSIFVGEDNSMLIFYLSGLTDSEAAEVITAAKDDFSAIFKNAEAINTMGYVLFDGEQLSPLISTPEKLGSIDVFKSKKEVWFSLNFEAAEKDYSVLYKCRIRSRN